MKKRLIVYLIFYPLCISAQLSPVTNNSLGISSVYGFTETEKHSIKTSTDSSNIFVALDGSDSNSGAIGSPLKTLEAARDLIRNLRSKSKHSDVSYVVWVRGGRYPVTNTLTLEKQDSGTQDAPMVIRGYPGENAILDGSRIIPTAGFNLVKDTQELARLHPNGRGNVYAVPVTDQALQNILKNPDAQLTLNDQMMQQSRYPNIGFDYVESADISQETKHGKGTADKPLGAKITIRGKFKGNWQSELKRTQKARLIGYVSAQWYKEILPLHSVDNTGKIQLLNGSGYGLDRLGKMRRPRRPYFDNLLCEIDQPGEWYYDDVDNKLYLWPYADAIDTTAELGVWAGPQIFNIHADHIRIENLTMQCLGKKASFVDIHGTNTIVAGCTMRYSTNAPYNIWQSARDSGLLSCDLYDNNGGGRLYAGSVSNKSIAAGNCFVENCHFTQIYSKSFYGKVIAIGGAGNIFRNNLAHNHNGQIVTMSGVDHLVELNEIFNTGIEEGDGGSFYQGASFASVNNTFKHNFWHHIMCIPGMYERAAIFSDDGDCFDNVIENVFYKAGTCFKMNGGAGHTAHRNVMLDSRIGLHTLSTGADRSKNMYDLNMSLLDSRTSNKSAHLYRGLSQFGIDGWQETATSKNWNTHISPWWRKRYPVMDDLFSKWWNEKKMLKYSTFKDNIEYSNRYGFNVGPQATLTGTVKLENLNDFVDPSALNFKFKDSAVWAPDIPFEKIGLYIDKYRTAIPDKNAYRKAVKDHWTNHTSEGRGGYNPDTINARNYFNTGKLLFNGPTNKSKN